MGEDFSAEIPPDSSLRFTIGLTLLPDKSSCYDQRLHSTNIVLGTSAVPSPSGIAELDPPAWARDRRLNRPCSLDSSAPYRKRRVVWRDCVDGPGD